MPISWTFLSEGGDIAFQIYFKDRDSNVSSDVVPPSRVESHLFTEEGQITCDSVGKCN